MTSPWSAESAIWSVECAAKERASAAVESWGEEP